VNDVTKLPPLGDEEEVRIKYERAGITQEARLQALWGLMLRFDPDKANKLDARMRKIENASGS